jgi:cytochrome P450
MDLWPLGPEQLIITDPEFANEYVTARRLPKHALQAVYLDPIIGKGNMIAANGTYWKRLHDMIAPAFSVARTFKTISQVAEECETFYHVLKEHASGSEVVRFEQAISALAFDIISKSIFGIIISSQKRRSEDLCNLDTIIKEEFAIRNTWSPFAKRRLNRAKEQAIRSLDDSIRSKLRTRFNTVNEQDIDLSHKQDLCILDLILRDYIQSDFPRPTTMDPQFESMAINNIKTIFLAGSGTVTDTLCFTFMLLSAHPEVVSKLREEHTRVFSSDVATMSKILEAEPQRLKQLDYTNSVIMETLRIYPIGNTGRAPDAPGFINYKGQRLPLNPDTLICPVQHTWQMSPDVFPNPDVFLPERFIGLGSPELIAWRPFERGYRSCIGQSLAMEEMKTVLLYTVQFFDLACHDLKPNNEPRVPWTRMDTVFGDRAFQEFLTEARPRDGMPMLVKHAIQ